MPLFGSETLSSLDRLFLDVPPKQLLHCSSSSSNYILLNIMNTMCPVRLLERAVRTTPRLLELPLRCSSLISRRRSSNLAPPYFWTPTPFVTETVVCLASLERCIQLNFTGRRLAYMCARQIPFNRYSQYDRPAELTYIR